MLSKNQKEWIEVGGTASAQFFVLTNSIEDESGLSSILVMQNLKREDDKGEMSRVFKLQFDLYRRLKRRIWLKYYSEKMGRGEIIEKVGEALDWTEVKKKTPLEIIFNYVFDKNPYLEVIRKRKIKHLIHFTNKKK